MNKLIYNKQNRLKGGFVFRGDNMSDQYAIYLRKSRADLEAESRGEGETLARHKARLLELAKRQSLSIGAIYTELVSGETIASRPKMQQLLNEVESGKWAGVLVAEVTRLARGDTIDQGVVAQAFKLSSTKIVTPDKTYDPTNDYDEEYFEFGLFMSRREYKMITRRQDAGRKAARKEGRFIGNRAPFGYERVKLPDGWTLRIVEEQAVSVREAFRLYLSGLGCVAVANQLNTMDLPAPNGKWVSNSIPGMLRNPHYAGYTTSGRRPQVKVAQKGNATISRPRNHEATLYEGKHQAIISREDWNAVQNIFASRQTSKVPGNKNLTNPLAGLIYCSQCGKKMQKKTGQYYDTLLCTTPHCKTVSNNFSCIEQLLLSSLKIWMKEHSLSANEAPPSVDAETAAIKAIQNKQSKTKERLNKLYELLETGVYSAELFLQRQKELNEEINTLLENEQSLLRSISCKETVYQKRLKFLPQLYSVLDAYPSADIEEKNRLLKLILHKVEYHKTTNNRWSDSSDLSLVLYPIIPR